MRNNWNERRASPEAREAAEALKWALGALFVGIGFTFPVWAAMLGLY